MANPYLIAALGPALTGIMGGLFGQDEAERQEKLTREQLAAQERSRQQAAAVTALGATQMNPLAQQEFRQNNAIRASLLNRSTRSNAEDPSSGVNWNPADFASFFTPEARQNAENAFSSNAAAASNGQYQAQTGVGYGGDQRPVENPTLPVNPTQQGLAESMPDFSGSPFAGSFPNSMAALAAKVRERRTQEAAKYPTGRPAAPGAPAPTPYLQRSPAKPNPTLADLLRGVR